MPAPLDPAVANTHVIGRALGSLWYLYVCPHIILLLEQSEAFPLTDPYLNITSNEAGQHEQRALYWKRCYILWCEKSRDGTFRNGSYRRSHGHGPGYYLKRKGEIGQHCGFLGKACLSKARVNVLQIRKQSRLPVATLAYSLLGFQHQNGHCTEDGAIIWKPGCFLLSVSVFLNFYSGGEEYP